MERMAEVPRFFAPSGLMVVSVAHTACELRLLRDKPAGGLFNTWRPPSLGRVACRQAAPASFVPFDAVFVSRLVVLWRGRVPPVGRIMWFMPPGVVCLHQAEPRRAKHGDQRETRQTG